MDRDAFGGLLLQVRHAGKSERVTAIRARQRTPRQIFHQACHSAVVTVQNGKLKLQRQCFGTVRGFNFYRIRYLETVLRSADLEGETTVSPHRPERSDGL